MLATPAIYVGPHHIRVVMRALSPQSTHHLRRSPFRNRKQAVRAVSTTPTLRWTGAMSLVLDCEHAVGPSLLALLTQKILMWGPTVGVIGRFRPVPTVPDRQDKGIRCRFRPVPGRFQPVPMCFRPVPAGSCCQDKGIRCRFHPVPRRFQPDPNCSIRRLFGVS